MPKKHFIPQQWEACSDENCIPICNKVYSSDCGNDRVNDVERIVSLIETKGYSDDEVLDYRSAESVKIECARRHFATISNSTVTYKVVNSYADLRNVITK